MTSDGVICCIKDAKAEIYDKWFFVDTVGIAIRMFSDAVKAEGTPLHDHPEDFSLWLSGRTDGGSGIVDGEDVPTCICRAIDVAKGEG